MKFRLIHAAPTESIQLLLPAKPALPCQPSAGPKIIAEMKDITLRMKHPSQRGSINSDTLPYRRFGSSLHILIYVPD